MSPAALAAKFIEGAALYGPSVVSSVQAIWQSIQGAHPELRAAPAVSTRDAIDDRIDARLRELGLVPRESER